MSDEPPLILYHWSPASRRAGIERHGLKPGAPSRRDKRWRPPFVSYATDPAFALRSASESIAFDEPSDLWMIHQDDLPGVVPMEVLEWPHGTEWRVYDRIPRRCLTWIARRSLD